MAATKRAAGTKVPRRAGETAPVPEECARFVRRRVAEELPAICESLLEKARRGDATALKTLWQIAGLGRAMESVENGADDADAQGAAFARAALRRFGRGSELLASNK